MGGAHTGAAALDSHGSDLAGRRRPSRRAAQAAQAAHRAGNFAGNSTTNPDSFIVRCE